MISWMERVVLWTAEFGTCVWDSYVEMSSGQLKNGLVLRQGRWAVSMYLVSAEYTYMAADT